MLFEEDFSTSQRNNWTYSREQLLALKSNDALCISRIPKDIRRPYRGCRAGQKVRKRALAKRWKFKPAIPSCVMGNVNSLSNKADELGALVRNDKLYRESSVMVFTETWLCNNITDATIELPGFSQVRADRDPSLSGKSKGGGLIIYINERWCNPNHITVKNIICCPDVELLSVSLRPYYLPREFTNVIVMATYINPRATAETACDVIHSNVAKLQAQYPDAFIAISGDFNHVTLDSALPCFYQYVNCNTRQNRIIDLLYANIKDAYTATPLPPLGRSDHNLVFLQPLYTPRVRRDPVTKITVKKFSPEVDEVMRDCLASTDWSVFQQSWGEDIDGLAHCYSDYLNFCEDIVVPTKTVHCFPNNKPWITSNVKALLNNKKRAFKEGDQEKMKQAQVELKVKLKEAKEEYRQKIEVKLQDNNMHAVWDGMKSMTGMKKSSRGVEGDLNRANEFNNFYNRFDHLAAGAAPTPSAGAAFEGDVKTQRKET